MIDRSSALGNRRVDDCLGGEAGFNNVRVQQSEHDIINNYDICRQVTAGHNTGSSQSKTGRRL